MQERGEEPPQLLKPSPEKNDELQELREMLNQGELSTIHRFGGRMHRETTPDNDADSISLNSHQPRRLIKEPEFWHSMAGGERASGKLSGVYQNYLLVRRYPSLRILSASPSLRVPGILQSPFLNKIGRSDRVRHELTAAMAEGRGVTAQGGNGQIGVWMVVIVDEQQEDGAVRRWRPAPPVAASATYSQVPAQKENQNRPGRMRSKASGQERRLERRRTASQPVRNGYVNGTNGHSSVDASVRHNSVPSHSPTWLRID